MKQAFAIAMLVLMGVSCSDDEKPKFVTGHGDRTTDAGTFEERDASADEELSNGPVLEFTAPAAAKTPSDDMIVTEEVLTVRCRVTKRSGGSSVDRSSVAITMDKNADSPDRIKAATNALPNDEYEAKFDLSSTANGPLRFHCEARDLARKPQTSTKTLETFLDLGPSIEVFEPQNKQAYALKTPVGIQFQVTAAPLADTDDAAEVKEVTLTVSGTSIALTESEDMPGLYKTSVDFNDPKLFKVPPTSSEVLISATNARAPVPATRTVKLDIGIDGVGPTIKVTSPANLALVHGEVTLQVTVDDASGVEARTLTAVVKGTEDITITNWETSDGKYQQSFDTRASQIASDFTQLTIQISAEDTVGNQTTIPFMLRLDNLPPVLSLDPPLLREWREIGGDGAKKILCSEAFDPLGAAASDGDVVLEASRYRVFIEDKTNVARTADGGNFGYYAGVATGKVELYAQADPSIPLLIDTDGNGICDEINYEAIPESQRPTKVRMTALNPTGTAWFSKTVNFHEAGSDLGSNTSCMANTGGTIDPPKPICMRTDMIRALPGRGTDRPPAVYAMNPTSAECEGGYWELGPIVGEGWACLAARAEDTIGNIGISAPLRVCVRREGSPAQCDPSIASSWPGCAQNCTISAGQKFQPNQVWEQH